MLDLDHYDLAELTVIYASSGISAIILRREVKILLYVNKSIYSPISLTSRHAKLEAEEFLCRPTTFLNKDAIGRPPLTCS